MLRLLRCLCCLSLTLALALTGASVGAAGVAMAGEAGLQHVVLCGGGTLLLDASGKPVAPEPTRKCGDCPACFAAQGAALPGRAAIPGAPDRLLFITAVPDLTLPAQRPALRARARAPPKVS